jgi:hypothetical protein
MSTAAVNAVPVNTTTFPIHLTISAVPNLLPVVRRPSHQQGRALELLGHAIEYLIDSELGGPFGDGLSPAISHAGSRADNGPGKP